MFNCIINNLIAKEEKIAVIGLGYVGYPLAEALSKTFSVIGFDIDSNIIDRYAESGKEGNIVFSSNSNVLNTASVFIVAVPTPVDKNNRPDFSALVNASELVGSYLKKDALVIYESTVYPGATEEICIPILEKKSGLKCKDDFKVGYSPERLSPGDDEHNIYNVIKIVSGIDLEALQSVQFIYQNIVKAGVYPVSSIRVAEAIKVIENSQRDVNIAFMNEMAMMLDFMNINSTEVFEGMKTKWNALNFYPGLVGGHCISVDPYYLIFESKRQGYSGVILSEARKINDSVNDYISNRIIKQFEEWKLKLAESKVLILGATFKEDCDDVRNSKVVDIYKSLILNNIKTYIYDPIADSDKFYEEYQIKLSQIEDIVDVNCILIAVSHKQFQTMTIEFLNEIYGNVNENNRLLFVVKDIFDKNVVENSSVKYMHL